MTALEAQKDFKARLGVQYVAELASDRRFTKIMEHWNWLLSLWHRHSVDATRTDDVDAVTVLTDDEIKHHESVMTELVK